MHAPAKAKRFYSVGQRLHFVLVQFGRDIGVAISFLTTKVRNPHENDWKKLRRILMYLNGTKRNVGLTFTGDSSTELVRGCKLRYS